MVAEGDDLAILVGGELRLDGGGQLVERYQHCSGNGGEGKLPWLANVEEQKIFFGIEGILELGVGNLPFGVDGHVKPLFSGIS